MRFKLVVPIILACFVLALIRMIPATNAEAAAPPAITGTSQIETVLGSDIMLPFSDKYYGMPATQIPFRATLDSGLVIGSDGTLYATLPGQVIKVGADGILRPVVGSCTIANPHYPACALNSTGDGGPALEATVSNSVKGLAFGPDGSLYIADGYKVRRILPNGIITTVAGGDQSGFSGDGGPATQATFGDGSFFIEGLAVAVDGTLYIADPGNDRVRKVDPNGIVSTIAGKSGNWPNCSDIPSTGNATDIFLENPRNLAIGPDGALYVSNGYCAFVRRIAGGISSLVIAGLDNGTGTPGVLSSINQGLGLAFGPEGGLYLSYYYGASGNQIYTQASGSSSTALTSNDAVVGKAGNNFHFSGDGGPAKDAEMAAPGAITFGPDGALFVLDALNHRVRRIAPVFKNAISPANGGNVASVSNTITLQFPGGAVDASTNITLTIPAQLGHPTEGYHVTRHHFAITAADSVGPVTTFKKPYTLTLAYQSNDLQNVGISSESLINLFFWNGTKWQPALPCAGCSIDTTNHRITVVLDHLTDFALMAPVTHAVYIPTVRR